MMKGLLYKDIVNLKQQGKVYLLILGLWIAVGIANKDAAFFGGVMSVFAVLIPLSAVAYDEESEMGSLCPDHAHFQDGSGDVKVHARFAVHGRGIVAVRDCRGDYYRGCGGKSPPNADVCVAGHGFRIRLPAAHL